MVKIIPLGNNTYQCRDFRGEFTVHDNVVIDMTDTRGQLHLPMHTTDDDIRSDIAVYDLDQRTGFPVLVRFAAYLCKDTALIWFVKTFKHTNTQNTFEFCGYSGAQDWKPEYSLIEGKTIKDFLLAVVRKTYDANNFTMYEAFKMFHADHFKNSSWRKYNFQNILEIYEDYNGKLTYCNVINDDSLNLAVPNKSTGLNGVVKANYRLVKVAGFNRDEPVKTIVMPGGVSILYPHGHDFEQMFTDLLYRTPVYGVLTIGTDEYSVGDYLSNIYDWNPDEFTEQLFQRHTFNKSIRQIIINRVDKYKVLSYEWEGTII